MNSFFADLFRYQFLQFAILAGVLSAVSCGIVGSYVTTRRITYVAGAIAHSVLGGMGAARYLNVVAGWKWLLPVHGAVVTAVLAAIIIAGVSHFGRQREDTVLSAIWAIGMAAGILFIYATPGYSQDLMSYLFGNILIVKSGDLLLMGALDVIILALSFFFYTKLLGLSFDEEFTRLRGVRVQWYYLLLLVMTALTVVVLVQVVGLVMVIALLSLPAATASHFSKRLWQMMVGASFLSLLYTVGGIYVSYAANLPTGATIIIVSGVVYLLTTLVKRRFGRRRRQAAAS
ncbi:MAG TPA: metal ABC transporter permease [Spirochaetia bacterium]|nr:metal ABC transporter permease [Spirochaetia bacterium]